jgi:hypothetical protein
LYSSTAVLASGGVVSSACSFSSRNPYLPACASTAGRAGVAGRVTCDESPTTFALFLLDERRLQQHTETISSAITVMTPVNPPTNGYFELLSDAPDREPDGGTAVVPPAVGAAVVPPAWHFGADLAADSFISPGCDNMVVRKPVGFGLVGVHRQHGSPSSWPLVMPSPSESIMHSALFHCSSPTLLKSRPN